MTIQVNDDQLMKIIEAVKERVFDVRREEKDYFYTGAPSSVWIELHTLLKSYRRHQMKQQPRVPGRGTRQLNKMFKHWKRMGIR